MADLLGAVSSWLGKLKPRRTHLPEPDANYHPEKIESHALDDEVTRSLAGMDPTQLHGYISQQSERAVIRLLQSVSDSELQLRIIQKITEESTLKRVIRSELSKKLKRAAEKKLRESGSVGAELRLAKLAQLSERLQSFLRNPKWLEAPELLSVVFDPQLLEGSVDKSSPQFEHFDELRNRLKREIEEYEKTCAEMDALCDDLDPSLASRPLSGAANAQLQNRWKDLEEKYSFPKNFDLIQRYHRLIEARSGARPPTAKTPAHEPKKGPSEQDEAREARKQQELQKQQEKSQAERQKRLEAVENILRRIRELGENLAHRHAGAQLRELQNELVALRRWRRDYPAQLDEAESLLKTLFSKRSEFINEAQWDSWARTDLATRIQTELEKTIGELEAEQDSETALKKSAGLTQRLFEYAKEMRELGSLERGKDHKIWEQFKSLSDRGWVICDKMRALLLEKLKAALSDHAAKELDFTGERLAPPRATLDLKVSAFEDEASSRIKELQALWREIGAKPTEQNHEVETAGAKLFEIYFRQSNLHFGRIKRVETDAVQKKRDVLKEMKITFEGKSSLLARIRVAKNLEERWKKTPLPESVSTELEKEFGSYQTRLNAELFEEAEKGVCLALGLQTQAETTLGQIRAKSGINLNHALKSLSGLEADCLAIDRHLAQFAGLHQTVPGADETARTLKKRLAEIGDRLKEVFKECRAAAQQETMARSQERDQVLLEAQRLALSSEWDSAQARFEELKALWKKVGLLGQSQDAVFELLFDNTLKFYLARTACKAQTFTPEQKDKCHRTRRELLYSLDALTRFQDPKTAAEPGPNSLELPISEEERAKSAGKILELGLKYKQILSLDPKTAIFKETKKIMEQWSKLGTPDEECLAGFWRYYLDRIYGLLGVSLCE